jgi:hypothetical protein
MCSPVPRKVVAVLVAAKAEMAPKRKTLKTIVGHELLRSFTRTSYRNVCY